MKTKEIKEEFYPFMENKTRGTKAYTNITETKIILLDPRNFYKNAEEFRNELLKDMLDSAYLRNALYKINSIEKTVKNVNIIIINNEHETNFN